MGEQARNKTWRYEIIHTMLTILVFKTLAPEIMTAVAHYIRSSVLRVVREVLEQKVLLNSIEVFAM